MQEEKSRRLVAGQFEVAKSISDTWRDMQRKHKETRLFMCEPTAIC